MHSQNRCMLSVKPPVIRCFDFKFGFDLYEETVAANCGNIATLFISSRLALRIHPTFSLAHTTAVAEGAPRVTDVGLLKDHCE